MKMKMTTQELVKAVEEYQMENPSNSYLNVSVDRDGIVELYLEDDISIISCVDTKQSIINTLILAGVLEEGQIVKSEDE